MSMNRSSPPVCPVISKSSVFNSQYSAVINGSRLNLSKIVFKIAISNIHYYIFNSAWIVIGQDTIPRTGTYERRVDHVHGTQSVVNNRILTLTNNNILKGTIFNYADTIGLQLNEHITVNVTEKYVS